MVQPIDKYVPGGVRFVFCFLNVEKSLFLSARRLFEVGCPLCDVKTYLFVRLFVSAPVS